MTWAPRHPEVGGVVDGRACRRRGRGRGPAATPAIVVGAVTLSGTPLSQIAEITVHARNADGSIATDAHPDYEVKWGTVDETGVFTADDLSDGLAPESRLYLLFKGGDAGDHENPAAYLSDGRVAAELALEVEIDKVFEGVVFTGVKNAQADGATTTGADDDIRSFSYSGGAVTVDTSVAAGTLPAPTVADGAVVTHTTWTLTFAHIASGPIAVASDDGSHGITLNIPADATVDQVLQFIADNADAGETFAQLLIGREEAGNRAKIDAALESLFAGDKISQGEAAAATEAQLTVTVADVTLYTSDGTVIKIAGGTLGSGQPGYEDYVPAANDVVYAEQEGGVWVLKLGPNPASDEDRGEDAGDYYVLSGPLTPGTTPKGAAAANQVAARRSWKPTRPTRRW